MGEAAQGKLLARRLDLNPRSKKWRHCSCYLEQCLRVDCLNARSQFMMQMFFPHPAWPLVDGALLVSKRRSPAPDDLLTFVRPLCRPVGDPKPRACRAARVLLWRMMQIYKGPCCSSQVPNQHVHMSAMNIERLPVLKGEKVVQVQVWSSQRLATLYKRTNFLGSNVRCLQGVPTLLHIFGPGPESVCAAYSLSRELE